MKEEDSVCKEERKKKKEERERDEECKGIVREVEKRRQKREEK